MKYFIVLAGGLADEPAEELDGRTPLESADTPYLDLLAERGKLAAVTTLPAELPASEEVALLSSLGYDPSLFFSGEAGLAATDLLSSLPEGQIAFLHNLATEADGCIVDHAAGHIGPTEAESLLESLREALPRGTEGFRVGRGYLGLTIMHLPASRPIKCLPPEATWNTPIEKCLPRGEGSETVQELITRSREIFAEHEVNRVRADLGENPANILWPWGPGRPPDLPAFTSRHRLQASLIAAAPSARGLGTLAAMEVPDIEGATGLADTDYAAKVRRAVDSMALNDVVVIHLGAASEASLDGDPRTKRRIAQEIDAHVMEPLYNYATQNEFVRILFLPTHTADSTKRCRLRHPVPAVLFGPGFEAVRGLRCVEASVPNAEILVERGHELMEYYLRA